MEGEDVLGNMRSLAEKLPGDPPVLDSPDAQDLGGVPPGAVAQQILDGFFSLKTAFQHHHGRSINTVKTTHAGHGESTRDQGANKRQRNSQSGRVLPSQDDYQDVTSSALVDPAVWASSSNLSKIPEGCIGAGMPLPASIRDKVTVLSDTLKNFPIDKPDELTLVSSYALPPSGLKNSISAYTHLLLSLVRALYEALPPLKPHPEALFFCYCIGKGYSKSTLEKYGFHKHADYVRENGLEYLFSFVAYNLFTADITSKEKAIEFAFGKGDINPEGRLKQLTETCVELGPIHTVTVLMFLCNPNFIEPLEPFMKYSPDLETYVGAVAHGNQLVGYLDITLGRRSVDYKRLAAHHPDFDKFLKEGGLLEDVMSESSEEPNPNTNQGGNSCRDITLSGDKDPSDSALKVVDNSERLRLLSQQLADLTNRPATPVSTHPPPPPQVPVSADQAINPQDKPTVTLVRNTTEFEEQLEGLKEIQRSMTLKDEQIRVQGETIKTILANQAGLTQEVTVLKKEVGKVLDITGAILSQMSQLSSARASGKNPTFQVASQTLPQMSTIPPPAPLNVHNTQQASQSLINTESATYEEIKAVLITHFDPSKAELIAQAVRNYLQKRGKHYAAAEATAKGVMSKEVRGRLASAVDRVRNL